MSVVEGPDDEHELSALRKTLDTLNSLRLSGPLNEQAAELYEALCAREAELLQHLRSLRSA